MKILEVKRISIDKYEIILEATYGERLFGMKPYIIILKDYSLQSGWNGSGVYIDEDGEIYESHDNYSIAIEKFKRQEYFKK